MLPTHTRLYEEIEIDKIISGLDSDLWKAVCLLTQPRSAKNEKNTVKIEVKLESGVESSMKRI